MFQQQYSYTHAPFVNKIVIYIITFLHCYLNNNEKKLRSHKVQVKILKFIIFVTSLFEKTKQELIQHSISARNIYYP